MKIPKSSVTINKGLNVGKGGVSVNSGGDFERVETYWNNTYTTTGDWTTAYGLQWTEPYNTEIP